jgi:nitroreductase|tara:strand:- start:115 stop:672 length:558 start_codon:yes stop_codon:yes gene_type:complete
LETLEAIQTRNSVPLLTDPAPTSEEMSEVYKGALRAPDHARLRPWKFIEVRGDSRDKLAKIFIDTATALNSDLSENEISKLEKAPHRAPMVIILAANIKEHPKVPEIEQIISLGAAAQNILLGIHEIGYSAVWRTGNMAFNPEITKFLGLEENFKIIGYLYVGTSTGKEKPIPELEIQDFLEVWD